LYLSLIFPVKTSLSSSIGDTISHLCTKNDIFQRGVPVVFKVSAVQEKISEYLRAYKERKETTQPDSFDRIHFLENVEKAPASRYHTPAHNQQ